MIKIENISKSYRTNEGWNLVLDNINAEFPTNRSIGILGLNGSGKSTLLKLIGGVEDPDKGSIYKDVKLSWPIGFTGGFAALMTGREATRFVSRIYGESIKRMEEFVYDFSELGDYFDMPIESYSSGMRARLAFAASMAIDFDCYLVDEVTAVGDARFKAKYKDAFKKKSKHASIIMVSHHTRTIKEFCEITAVLFDGKISMYDSVEQGVKAYEEKIRTHRRKIGEKYSNGNNENDHANDNSTNTENGHGPKKIINTETQFLDDENNRNIDIRRNNDKSVGNTIK